jgi:hypothetical protein
MLGVHTLEGFAMSCFSLPFWENVCIMIVIVIALWSLIQLLLPYLTPFLPGIVIQIIRIVIWAIVAIAVIKIIFDLLACLLGAGGMHPFR